MTKLNEVTKSSVIQKSDAFIKTQIIQFAQYDQYAPPWWSTDRDRWLREFWIKESFLTGAIYSIASRNSSFGWELTGLEDDVAYSQDMLQAANFGDGWQSLILQTTTDLLTQDNGAFIEVIRPARVRIEDNEYKAFKMRYENDNDSWYANYKGKWLSLAGKNYSVYDTPIDLPIGLAHLDSGQCQRTGDPEIPVIYTDRYGKCHKLRWWQVLSFTDMPSPIERMNGVGYCAITRVLRAAHVADSMSIYKDEKISGRFNRAVILTNADADTINDAIQQTGSRADGLGLLRYSQPVVAQTFTPDAVPAIATINLAEIPDGFNENDTMNWYIAQLANALGVDYGFLAPLPGKGLGTASQSETADKQSKGKSSRQFMDMISNALNFKGVLPESVQFAFVERNAEDEKQQESVKKARAETRKIMLENGEITSEIARQMAVDSGDLDKQYLELLGSEDLTLSVTQDGDENIDSEQAVAEGESEVKQIKLSPRYTRQRVNLWQRVKMLVRTFNRKQIDLPETITDDMLKAALANYADDLEALALSAQQGDITRAEFERQMRDMVTLALTTFYADMVGVDPADFSDEDLAILEDYIAVNMESVTKLADDIYAGRYADTEERDGTLMLLGRLGLWVIAAWGIATIAQMNNPANSEKRYRFNLGGTIEHCTDCARLNGQVHTASEWAANSQWLPRSHSLECNGYRCACYLSETNDAVNGSF